MGWGKGGIIEEDMGNWGGQKEMETGKGRAGEVGGWDRGNRGVDRQEAAKELQEGCGCAQQLSTNLDPACTAPARPCSCPSIAYRGRGGRIEQGASGQLQVGLHGCLVAPWSPAYLFPSPCSLFSRSCCIVTGVWWVTRQPQDPVEASGLD